MVLPDLGEIIPGPPPDVVKELPIDKQPGDRVGGRDFNLTAVNVLSQRIKLAVDQGAKNIAVDARLLQELLEGCKHAITKADWRSIHKL